MPDGTRTAASDSPMRIVADGPVLVFGGCYSNREATEALLAEAARLGVPPARMICTGDVIAYGADPLATLDLVRAAGIATVMGNCEEALAAQAADCGCGFPEGSACARLSDAWFAHADCAVDEEARRWMAGLPRRIELVLGGRRLAVVHGAPSRINRFVFASSPESELAAELARADADGVIAGHCGLPFTRQVGQRLWHNAGAIGLPANDGTARGWFSLLTPVPEEPSGTTPSRRIRVRHLPLAYDHRAAARAMRAAGLPEGYAAALERGIWPSFDILPPEEQSATGRKLAPAGLLWGEGQAAAPPPRAQRLFADPLRTAAGEPHARVPLERLETLWFNTGTLCNIACAGCYIESSPRNDRLSFLARADFDRFLDEAASLHPELREIGFTGGEPFMNPAAPGMIEAALARGYEALVLTNAMRPMQRRQAHLARMRAAHGGRLGLRVSLDAPTRASHEAIRGPGTFAPALAGLAWLAGSGFRVSVAARLAPRADAAEARAGFAALFAGGGIELDAFDPAALVLFPELGVAEAPPEVGKTCWQALAASGRTVMCASARMVVHRKGEAAPSVVACTLQPYERRFDLGPTLAAAARTVTLNHPHCARFCVFGAASCSAGAAMEVTS
jgi:predicted phosphodiesterase